MSALTALKTLRATHKPPNRWKRVMNAMRQVAAACETTAKASRNKMVFGSRIRIKARAGAYGNRSFSGVAYTGGVMFPTIETSEGKIERMPIILDLDTLQIPNPERPVLDDHDETPDGVIGRTTAMAVSRPAYNLPVKGVLYGEKDRAKKYLQAARGGHKWQLSVGTDSFTLESVKKGESVRVNGRSFAGPVMVARNAYLVDLSFVAVGGDDRTEAVIE